MTEFTPEFVAGVFGRTAAEPEILEVAPTSPVIPGQGDMATPVGDSGRLFVNQLFDRIA